ncbi:MAG: hypothetical protein G01um10143_17 [Parcubacteria group bacterium Gr01-1014_3]|nr:MAG: hypothetical protein G01um10143_17 [Parcubacteria group bacterium Gr01-1014_3]
MKENILKNKIKFFFLKIWRKSLGIILTIILISLLPEFLITGETPWIIKKIIPVKTAPGIRVNLTEVQRWKLTDTIHDAHYLFSTSRGQGLLIAVKDIDFGLLNRAAERVFITTDFLTCTDCSEYNTDVVNIGPDLVREITIELDGGSKIIPFFDKDVPAGMQVNCKRQTGCTLVIDSLAAGETLKIPLLGGSGGITISCTVEGKQEFCHKDYIKVFASFIPPGFSGDITATGVKTKIPPLNNSSSVKCYKLDGKSIRWLSVDGCFFDVIGQGGSEMTKQDLEKILRANGHNFDISSIPDGTIINNYEIKY